jgi:hypothetical protein
MRQRTIWTYLPPGPLLSLLLVGLVLLFGLLYYRAIRIQRFLEPALALSKPRSDFSDAILRIVEKEFGKGPVPGIDVRMGTIVIDQALLVRASGSLHPTGRIILQRFARIFKTLLEDAHTRADINLVLISAGYAPGPPAVEAAERIKTQRVLGEVLEGLFAAEPLLKENYQAFFAATPRPLPPRDGLRARIELRIMPSEMLHMEFLQRLQKYAL